MSVPLCPIALDLDGALRQQPGLWDALEASIDLTPFGERLRLRCSAATAAAARERIARVRQRVPAPWLTYLGSGDWHHLSLVLLETLTARRPVTLLLIDNHPDWHRLPPRYHCGNWLAGALRHSALEEVIIVGVDGPDLRTLGLLWAPYRELAGGRLRLIPWEQRTVVFPLRRAGGGAASARPFAASRRFPTCADAGADGMFAGLAEELAGRDVYISIDKDCLRRADASSDWEQGRMSLDQLRRGLGSLRRSCAVIGADCCGDRAMRPLKGLVKRMDAGRWRSAWAAPTSVDHERNQGANLAILGALSSTLPAYEASPWTRSHG